MDSTPPHIAIIPTPGMGHLIPLGEFAKKLHRLHGVTTTFILPTDGPLSSAQSSFFSSLPSAIDLLLLPPVSFGDLPSDVKIETRIFLYISRSLPDISRSLSSLHSSHNLSALVVDLFGTDAFDAARDLQIPSYIFYPSTAMALSMFLNLPNLTMPSPASTATCRRRSSSPAPRRSTAASFSSRPRTGATRPTSWRFITWRGTGWPMESCSIALKNWSPARSSTCSATSKASPQSTRSGR